MSLFLTRRQFSATIGSAFSFALSPACHNEGEQRQAGDGILTARPRPNIATSARPDGAIGLDRKRDAFLHLPPTRTSDPLPLLVLFHGAGGSGERVLRRLSSAADEVGVAVLAPDSRDTTWDAIRGSFGRDVAFLNRALERVFDSVAVDPARIAVGGFSDGASYAISLGLINGDLFPRVVAFSPGFVVEGKPRGTPRFFISHGTSDQILPIDSCSRRIVVGLQKRGYEVIFREFQGGHEVPADIAREGLAWAAGKSSA
jgi:phospholipase/carboxylesterase